MLGAQRIILSDSIGIPDGIKFSAILQKLEVQIDCGGVTALTVMRIIDWYYTAVENKYIFLLGCLIH